MPGRLGRSRPNRPILLRNPSFDDAPNVTGNLNVTLGAFTSSATATFGSSGAPSTAGGWGGTLNATGGTAFGGNVVHVVHRVPRRILRPTRVR